MKRFVLALLVVLLSLSALNAKENKKKKDPADDFDIENLNNGEWVAVALEQEPQSSNVFGSGPIRQAINQYVEDSEQQDIPPNSFTLQPPGFQQPHLSVLHSPPSSLNNPSASNKEPSELEMLYNEFVRQKMQSSAGNPLSANSESYLQQAFAEFLKQNPQQVLQMLKTAQTQPPVNNYNFDPHMSNINGQKNIAVERPQLFNYLGQQQNNGQITNYHSKQTTPSQQENHEMKINVENRDRMNNNFNKNPQRVNANFNENSQQIQSNFDDSQRFSQLQPQSNDASPLQANKQTDNVQPVIPLKDFLTFIRLQASSLDSTTQTPNNMRDVEKEGQQTEAPVTEEPKMVDPHDDKSYLLTDNDEFKIARDPNGNAILLSMVDNNGEWPAQSTHYAGNGLATEYSPHSTNNRNHYALHLSTNTDPKNYTNNSNDFTSIQNFQYDIQINRDRQMTSLSKENNPERNSFLEKRPHITTGFSPTEASTASFFQSTQSDFGTSPNGPVTESKQPNYLSNWPSTLSYDGQIKQKNYEFSVTHPEYSTQTDYLKQEKFNIYTNPTSEKHFLSKRPFTSASSFPTTVSGQKGQIDGSYSLDSQTTPNLRTGHEFYLQTQDSPLGTKNFYTTPSLSSLSANFESNIPSLASKEPSLETNANFLSNQNTPFVSTQFSKYGTTVSSRPVTEKSHTSTEYQYLTTQYNTSPYSSYHQSLNRQEEIKNPDSQSSTQLFLNTEEMKQTTVPFSTISKFTTLQTTYATTELPPIRETTLTDFPTSLTSSDEEEANLPPYNPYPNRPAYAEVPKKPESPPSHSNYGNYLSNYQSNSSPSNKLQYKVPEINYQQFAPASNIYGRPQENNFYSENNHQQYLAPNSYGSQQNFKPQSISHSYKNNNPYNTLSTDFQYASQFNRPSSTNNNIPVNTYESYRPRPHENNNQHNGFIESKPKPGNSWLVSNYLSSPYYSSEIFSKPEKPSYVENNVPASSYQHVQQQFDSKPGNVQYSSQFSVSSYPRPQSSSYLSQNYENQHFNGGPQGNYYSFQGGASNSHATVVTIEPPITTPLSSTTESSLRNSWNIPNLPLQSKQDTDIEDSLSKPVSSQNNQQISAISSYPQKLSSQDKENFSNFASYLQIQSPPSSNPIYGIEKEQSPSYPSYPQPPASNPKPVSSEHEINQNKPDFQSNYPESSFIPSNGPAPIKYPASHGIYPKPPSPSFPTYPSFTHNTKPMNNIEGLSESSYPRPQKTYPQFNQSTNPLNNLQDDVQPPANSVDQYTGEDLEPVYLPSDNCSTTFMVREDRQSVLGVRAMPGGAAECALTFLSPRQDKRLALQLLGINMPEEGGKADCNSATVSVFSQMDGRNLLVREFCGEVSTSPAILTESYSALVTVRAQPGTQRAGFTILAFLW